MKFYGVGNTTDPEDIPFGSHLRKEANLPPLQRQQMSPMVRDFWLAVMDAAAIGHEAMLADEAREQFGEKVPTECPACGTPLLMGRGLAYCPACGTYHYPEKRGEL